MVEEKSREYMCGKTFCFETPISDVDKNGAMVYNELGKEMIMTQTEKNGKQIPMVYVAGGDEDADITHADVDVYLEQNWSNFQNIEQFIKAVKSMYEISLPIDQNKWKSSICTCPQNSKKFICKHVMTIAIRMGLLVIEPKDPDDEPLMKN